MELDANELRRVANLLDLLAEATSETGITVGAVVPLLVRMPEWPYSLDVRNKGEGYYVLAVGSEG